MAAFSVAVACGGSAFTSGGGPDASSSGSSSGGRDGSSSSSGSGSGSGSSSGGTKDGGGMADGGGGGGDGSAVDGAMTCPSSPTRCGSMVCNGTGGQQGDLCCISSPDASPNYGCAACDCGCGDTQLDCARGDNCPATGQVCCIVATPCGGGSHYVATCQDRVACSTGGGKVMCLPGGTGGECLGGTCSPDTSSVGVPPSSGYGICD